MYEYSGTASSLDSRATAISSINDHINKSKVDDGTFNKKFKTFKKYDINIS